MNDEKCRMSGERVELGDKRTNYSMVVGIQQL